MGLDARRKAERDQRLDELVTLTKSWSKQTRKAYTDRATQLQRMLNGRGAGQVAQTTVQAASQLVVDEIDVFLTGG